jgi:hypothetical protein
MTHYEDISGDSGVSEYQFGADSITVRFKGGATYLYTAASAGRRRIATMKRLAASGHGLSTYISKHVKERYASRLE